MKWDISSLVALEKAAESIITSHPNGALFLLHGNLGSGKTTFVKACGNSLAPNENITSPTYAIVNVYGNAQDIYHLDLYRLENLKEALDIGIEEILDNAVYCFIEWPEIIEEITPDTAINIYFRNSEGVRTIEIK